MATPTPEWMRAPTAADILKKVPEATIRVAIDWAKTNPQPQLGERVPGSTFLRQPTEGSSKFAEFLKSRGITELEYNQSFAGTGASGLSLSQAIKQVGIASAEQTLAERLTLAQKDGKPVAPLGSTDPLKGVSPPSAKALQSVPEGSLKVAIEWTKTNPQPGGSPSFGEFLAKRGLTEGQFTTSLHGSGVDSQGLLRAVKEAGADKAQQVLLGRVSAAVAEGRPVNPLAPETKEAKMLEKLAQENPEGFKLAHGYATEKARNPAATLEGYLHSAGTTYSDYMQRVGSKSGEILQAMRAVPELAGTIGRFISHSKVGKVFTLATTLGGMIMEGAHASTIKQAAGGLAIDTAALVDPTTLLGGPSILEHVAAKAVNQPERSEMVRMGIKTENISSKAGVLPILERNQRIDREQAFIFDAKNPTGLAGFTMGGADGKPLDVAAALRDPAQRTNVMAEIDRQAAAAKTPEDKQKYTDMKESAASFVTMEAQRRELPADIVTAKTTSQTRVAAVPVVPAM